jgi:ABC-2 type transport system ATP-binding protein
VQRSPPIVSGLMKTVAVHELVVQRGGRTVLDGISLDVAAGRVTGLLGPSGCGKTTLMRAIVGVQRVATGTVEVLGLPAGEPPLRRRVGYVTQAPSIYADLSVRENLRYFARVLGVGDDAVRRCLATVDLEEFAGDRAGRLSGGQKARASLAVALLAEPEVLVLDEPTVGLDPVLRIDLWSTFRDMAAGGVTLLVSSHVMDEAERCDDIVLMRDGAVLANEPREQLLRRTGSSGVEQAFLTLVRQSP